MRPFPLVFAFLLLTAALSLGASDSFRQQGSASWYGAEIRKTASGEAYQPMSMTAAHRTLPFGTMVKVTNLRNNRSTVVRINNRGPFIRKRIIDLSKGAARELQMIQSGTAPVRLELVSR